MATDVDFSSESSEEVSCESEELSVCELSQEVESAEASLSSVKSEEHPASSAAAKMLTAHNDKKRFNFILAPPYFYNSSF